MIALAVATWLQIVGWIVVVLAGLGLMMLAVACYAAVDESDDEDDPEPRPVPAPQIPRRTKYVYHGRSPAQEARLRAPRRLR